MANSADVSAGEAATAVQYNDLREDVLDPITGHKHDGTAEGGTALGSPLIPKASDLVGDGSDGDVTIAAPTTLDSPRQFNSLILNAALTPAAGRHGLLIFVKGTLTINSGGSISANGSGGAGGNTGGVAGTNGFSSELGTIPDEVEGGVAEGEDGRKATAIIAAITDAGDDLFLGYGAGGGGGSFTIAPNNGKGGDKFTGGGAGGDSASNGGAAQAGAGGNGGGYVIIFADTIIVNVGGSILADGNDGGAAVVNFGGGGGGGGGLVYLAKRNFTNNGTITADGGAGSASGANQGGDGAGGQIVEKTIPS